jgi:pimeloyl-ACP methyl ester carboxylesterase
MRRRRRILFALVVAPALLFLGAAGTWLIAWRVESRYPPVGSFVEISGGRLHFVEVAPREARGTVVLLHGASANLSDSMLSLGRRLGERYRVIAFDRPGHGWSERIGGPASASPVRQAALVAQAMRRLGVSNAVVVAHSWAGSVAPNLALDHRDVTGGLVLLAGVTHPWPGAAVSWYYHPSASWLGGLLTRTVTTPVAALLMAPVGLAVFTPQEPPAEYLDEARIPLLLRPSVFRANAQDVAGLYAAVDAQKGRYGDIRVPVTVIGGDADRIVWTDLHSRSFAREVPGSKLVILPGVGHMPQYAEPDLVVREIEEVAAKARARL